MGPHLGQPNPQEETATTSNGSHGILLWAATLTHILSPQHISRSSLPSNHSLLYHEFMSPIYAALSPFLSLYALRPSSFSFASSGRDSST